MSGFSTRCGPAILLSCPTLHLPQAIGPLYLAGLYNGCVCLIVQACWTSLPLSLSSSPHLSTLFIPPPPPHLSSSSFSSSLAVSCLKSCVFYALSLPSHFDAGRRHCFFPKLPGSGEKRLVEQLRGRTAASLSSSAANLSEAAVFLSFELFLSLFIEGKVIL